MQLKKVFQAIKQIANLPQDTRDELRITFDETFRLLDTSLNMVIIRLGEILRISDDSAFAVEVGQLNFDPSWSQAEREFRLCSGLRHVATETKRLRHKILNHVSVQDWDEMQHQIQEIFRGEDYLGNYIAEKFQRFSDMTIGTNKEMKLVRDELFEFQKALNTERRRLINMEIDLFDNF